MRTRAAPIVLGLVLALHLAMAAANPMSANVHGDGYYTYLWARTIVFDGDLDFHDDYRVCHDPWGLASSPVGDDVNYWNLGPALFWVPILALERLSGDYDAAPPAIANACTGAMAEHAVMGSLVAGWLTVVLAYLFARRHFGEGPALYGAALVGLATSLPYYGTMLVSYGHAASSFGGALFLVAWDRLRARPSLRTWAWLGAAMGVAMLMRSQNAILAVLPAGTWLAQLERGARREGWRGVLAPLGHAALAVLLAVIVFAPQLVYWRSVTGSALTISQGEHYLRWGSPQIVGKHFSLSNGLFTWQPATYLAAAGFVVMLTRRPWRAMALPLVALFALDTYVVSCVYDWWGSIGFPGRRFDLLAAPFAVGAAALAAWIARGGRAHRARLGTALAIVTIAPLGLVNFAVMLGIATAMRADLPHTTIEHTHAVIDAGAAPMWRAMGNPLAWPGAIPFALRYGQHPRDWDVVGGQDIYYHNHQTLAWSEDQSVLPLGEPAGASYCAGTFGETMSLFGRSARVAQPGSARILVPLHWPDAGVLDLEMTAVERAPGARVRIGVTVNGRRAGMHDVPTGRFGSVLVDVPPGATHHGINEVWIWVEGGAVAISRLVVRDGEPPPQIEQEARNARALEALRRARGERP